MKKLYFFTIGLFLFASASAQYDLTDANNTPTAGDSYKIYKVEGSVNAGSSGADVSWDFSSLSTATEIDLLWEATDNATGNPDLYYSNPAVGLPNLKCTYDSTVMFFITSSSGMQTVGKATAYGGIMGIYQLMPYGAVVDYYDYPFAYQDKNTTSVTFSYVEQLGQFPLSGEVTGNFVVEYDGYGNITLPDGKYVSDVARIKITETYDKPSGGAGSISKIRNTFYEYREAFTPSWIARIEESIVTDATTSNDITRQNGYFVKGSQVQNVAELIANSNNMVVYPNPTVNEANISFDLDKRSDVIISVIDILGNTVSYDKMENLSAGNYNEILDMSNLTKGYYLVKLNINGKIQAQKIQKL